MLLGTDPSTPRPVPLWRNPDFKHGAKDMLDASLGIGAWGFVTGIAMVKGGLSVPMALFMSIITFSGSAQLAAVPLIAAGAPVWVVWTTALCLNLRFVIFSAGWRPFFGHLPLMQRMRLAYVAADFNFVYFMRRYPKPVVQAGQVEYFWGGASINWTSWQVMSVLGIVLGDRLPTEWGLAFAGALALVALTCTMLVDRAAWVAAGVAALATLAAYTLPYKLHILLAIACALGAGLMMDSVAAALRRARS